MPKISSLCVYCGSHSGNAPVHLELARSFGAELAKRDIALIYGGGKVGLMGTVADAVLAQGGKVIGVIPRQLVEKEVAHQGLSEIHVVETMHQRKNKMYELAQAFVALPGGFGTLDEMFEMLTWAQLGLHQWPCAFLDGDGYYDKLKQFVDHAVHSGFVRGNQRADIWFGQDIDALFAWMESYQARYTPAWTNPALVQA